MTDLKVFKSTEFGELGVMLIDGKEYFPATQCAKILGYAYPKDAITRHCKGAIKHRLPTAGGEQDVKFIPEGDLYRLIISSKLPAAEKFESWVFDEVLPSIRKTGAYGQPDIERLIAQTVSTAVSETIRQLMPMLTASELPCYEQQTAPKRRKPTGVIVNLSNRIRQIVDDMLLSGYSYRDVQNYLISNGISISQAAICRYYNNQLCIEYQERSERYEQTPFRSRSSSAYGSGSLQKYD